MSSSDNASTDELKSCAGGSAASCTDKLRGGVQSDLALAPLPCQPRQDPTRAALERTRRRIETSPRDFIAQPVIDLSVQPAYNGHALQPRHQDRRPFVLTSDKGVTVTPGGLT